MKPIIKPESKKILVVLPFCAKDWHLMEKILHLCVAAYGTTSHECLLTYDDLTDDVFVGRIKELAGKYFSVVHSYQYDAPMDKRWPQAPNHAFQRTAWHVYDRFKQPWLWLESDAIPLNRSWLDLMQAEYEKGEKPLMGHIVEGMGHCNGVAVYPWNLCHFTKDTFLVSHVAWDVVMKVDTIDHTHNANHLIAHVWNVDKKGKNINGVEGVPITFKTQKEVDKAVDTRMALFHRSKDGTLANLLCQRYAPQVQPATQSTGTLAKLKQLIA